MTTDEKSNGLRQTAFIAIGVIILTVATVLLVLFAEGKISG